MRTDVDELLQLLQRAADLEARGDDAELRRIKPRVVALAHLWARGVTPARAEPALGLSDRIKERAGRLAPLAVYFR